MDNSAKTKLFDIKKFPADFVRITGAPGLLRYRPKRIYTSENAKRKIRGGALLISNHVGFLDPMYIMMGVWYRRHSFIISEELSRSGAGGFLRLMGCIEIDRNNPSLGSFKKITARLNSGELVSMFPEGHIHTDESKPERFKSGMILMALQSGVPIVPVYIQPPKRFFDRLTLVIGESVDITRLCGERPTFAQINEATALLYSREQELKKYLQ